MVILILYIVLILSFSIFALIELTKKDDEHFTMFIVSIPFLLIGLFNNLYAWVMPCIHDQIRFFVGRF